MQPSIKAVRLENFTYQDWLAPLSQYLRSHYPGGTFLYQKPSVLLVLLNTTKPWGEDDEAFFAAMKRQAFFQRWETLAEVPPLPKASSTAYEDIGYRIGSGTPLTLKQQGALFSYLNDLDIRAILAEREAESQRNRADSQEEYSRQLVERYNHLIAIIEEINRVLQISVNGDFSGNCSIEDSVTGQILLRDTPLAEVYRVILQRRGENTDHKESRTQSPEGDGLV